MEDSFMLMTEETQEVVGSSQDVTELFIEVIRAKPLLYNTKDRFYKNHQAKLNAWTEIARIFGCTVEEAQKKWSSLRDCFNRHHKKVTTTQSGQGRRVTNQWAYYEAMLWYKDFTQLQRPTTSNFPRTSSSSSGESSSSSSPLFVPVPSSRAWPAPPAPSTPSSQESTPPALASTSRAWPASPLRSTPSSTPGPAPPPLARLSSQHGPQNAHTPSLTAASPPPTSPTTSPTPSSSPPSDSPRPPPSPQPLLPNQYARLVPPPDKRRKTAEKSEDKTDKTEEAIVSGLTAVTEVMRTFAQRPPSSDAPRPIPEDPVIEAFKTLVGVEYSEVPAARRSACRLAVLETISKFKD